ncbi:MAG: CotH kinase family protein [Ignavibacteriaceae bacterium]|nr:CotH kinase family protein [Ignavibacteriaceae bacterium]
MHKSAQKLSPKTKADMRIKLLILSLLLFLVNSQLIKPQNPGDSIFAGIKVHDINIHFYYTNYWDSLVYYYNLGTEIHIPADVILGDDTLENVGIRLKGQSSFNHPNNKKSIRLSFDEFESSLRWDGLKSIHLNNCYGDPTFMREKVYLDFCRDAGIVAPRANYARVFFNDTLYALYSLVEHVDKTFLSTRFGNKNGDLFKAVDAFGVGDTISDFKWFTSIPDSYYFRYELKTDESTTAWLQLVNFLDSLNNGVNTSAILPSYLNLDSFYTSIAGDIIFANLDSYINSGRNFYFYFNPATNKIEWIKWDVGLSFGCYSGGISNFENLSVTHVLNSSERPLFGKILTTNSLKNDYLYSLCTLNSSYFNTTKMFQHIDSIASVIRSYVYADSKKQYTNTQFEMNILSDLSVAGVGGTSRIPGLKSFLTARKNSINAQLTNLGINCTTDLEEEKASTIPNEYKLYQNYPNPFNPATTIKFDVPASGLVCLKVYNILGKEVKTLMNEYKNAGSYSVSFDAEGIASGVYLCQLKSGSTVLTKRMVLIK